MTLSTEQQNGKDFLSFVGMIKDLSKELKEHKECNTVLCYTNSIKDIENEIIQNLQVRASMMLSMMTGRVIIFRFSLPVEGHPDGETIMYKDPDRKDEKLVMNKEGKVEIIDEVK